LPVKSEKV